MRSLGQVALKLALIVGKLCMCRVFACGPISRKDEAKLRHYMASEPSISEFGLRVRRW